MEPQMETCTRHDVKLSFWCRTCATPACGECLFEEHPTHSHKVVKATTYVEDMKVAVKGIAVKFADALDHQERWHHQQVFQGIKAISDAIRTLIVLRKDIDDARDLVKGVHVVEGIGPTIALSEASKCLGLKWNLKGCQLDLMDTGWRQQERGEEKADGEGKVKEVDKEEEEEEEEGKVSEARTETGKESPAEALDEQVKTNDEKPDAAEKETDEVEALTEEERKKRRKILRLKEKLAAASAAAAAAAEKKDVTSRDKDKVDLKHKTEKRSAKEKGEKETEARKENDPESSKPLAADKTQRPPCRHAPASREPSASPPRDSAPGKDGHVTSKCELEADAETDASRKVRREGEGEASKAAESYFPARIEPLPKTKPDAASALKKPRGHADRQSLKKSKTVTFMVQAEDTAADDAKDDHSEDIRALDLHVPRLCRDDLDNKEKEEGVKEGTHRSGRNGKAGRRRRRRLRRTPRRRRCLRWSLRRRRGSPPNCSRIRLKVGFLLLHCLVVQVWSLHISVHVRPLTKHAQSGSLQTREHLQASSSNTTSCAGAERIQSMCFLVESCTRSTPKLFMDATSLKVPCLTLVVEGIGGRLAYVTWESMGLHVYCHQYQELPYDLLLKAPLVFLDVGTEVRVLGRVYISLWGHLRRAMNFLHLCLGDRGPSFRDSMFLEVMNADCPGERIRGGDYDCNNGRGGEALLDDLESQEGYSMPMEAGMVTAGGPNRKDQDSQFFICTEDDYDRRFACPFGRVVSGLPAMKEAVWLVMTKEIYIRDCGVVVEAPRI
ncbi:Peptidyl-prolyl cis-trans isomerase F, mitochondrial [Chionoecetes opilio]|uniref:Peptidyl-prolyl cis-trans isomerase F, mitochondrial n=1 Tax=Chionoecetes opilio TaxID=41210 RepID=A0A8J5CMC1_CHIOP|nr:Peptidyl-prolyl cis-trans isomerase F, mitochondrial [Chionoecetes opilio]